MILTCDMCNRTPSACGDGREVYDPYWQMELKLKSVTTALIVTPQPPQSTQWGESTGMAEWNVEWNSLTFMDQCLKKLATCYFCLCRSDPSGPCNLKHFALAVTFHSLEHILLFHYIVFCYTSLGVSQVSIIITPPHSMRVFSAYSVI